MSKLKLFIENFLVYGLGGIISNVIPLIMVPIVTRIMPSSEYYGINDMASTIMSFASYIAILGMYDAMYRLFFDSEDIGWKKRVCSTTLSINIITSLVVFIMLVAFRKSLASIFLNNEKYAYIICITAMTTFVGATNSIVSAPTRMQNKRKVFLIINTISPAISYSISIPMLLAGYFLIALPLAGLVSAFLVELIFYMLNRDWFDLKKFDSTIIKSLIKIGVPLMPNFLIYWVFNSCDKLMITKISGLADAGLYSVGAKLGLASQLIYTAFAGGWQYFAFYTMKEENQVKNNSRIFEYLGVISFIATFFICVISKPLYQILFKYEYHSSFIVSPYLFLAPLIQMLYQVAANQFLVIKKTWPTMFILSAGAVINVFLNYYLIPVIGIEGAAIATLLGYLISLLVCIIVLMKMRLMELRVRFFVAFIILLVFWGIWRFVIIDNVGITFILAILVALLILLLYKSDIYSLTGLMKKKIKSGSRI